MKLNLDNLYFSDTTLREGRQSEGSHITEEAAIDWAKLIDEIGFEYIELNHPASSKSAYRQLERTVNLGLKTKVATHVRCLAQDVKLAIDTGVKSINTLVSIDPRTYKAHGMPFEKVLENLYQVVKLTKKHKIELRVSLEHALTTPLEKAKKAYQKIASVEGVDRVGVADTTGIALPEKLKKYALSVYRLIPNQMAIQFHIHNDHGLAAASFYELLKLAQAGKRKAMFDISIAGFGERNGILSHGDVLSILYVINKAECKKKYKISAYAKLVKFIEKQIGIPISRRDPLNPWAFSHSAGPHLDGMLKGGVYQLIKPEDFGFTQRLNIGHSVTGYHGLAYFVEKEMKMDISEKEVKRIALMVREAASMNGPFTDKKLKEFIQENL